MTKEAYLSMCEQLNSEPKEEEIPVDFTDLPLEVEQAYHVYNILPAKIDSFNGVYYGKALEYAPEIMKFLEIDSRKDVFKVVLIIDALEQKEINKKRKS